MVHRKVASSALRAMARRPQLLVEGFYVRLGPRSVHYLLLPRIKLVHSKFIFNCGCRTTPPPALSPLPDFFHHLSQGPHPYLQVALRRPKADFSKKVTSSQNNGKERPKTLLLVAGHLFYTLVIAASSPLAGPAIVPAGRPAYKRKSSFSDA